MIHKEVGILNDGDLIFNTRIDTDGVTDGLRRTERETEKLSGTKNDFKYPDYGALKSF